MEEEPRRLRADAERNRRRLIEAATEMFGERGMEVGVAEIAQRACVGRGTLFRNFPSKEALIAAVVVEMLNDSIDRARKMLDAADPAEGLFSLIDTVLERQQSERALFEALDDAWMANPEIHAAHHELLEVLEQLLIRAQAAGGIRDDISAVDVLLMVKGLCETACAFQHVDAEIGLRQLDLVRAAITADGVPPRPLRGRPPTIEDLERHSQTICGAPAAAAGPAPLARPAAG